MAEHTPTPWRLRTSGNVGNAVEAFCGKTHGDLDDGFRIVATYQECISGVDYKTHVANAHANGQFIVRAVNSHDALVKALEQARDVLGRIADLSTALRSGGPDPMDLQDLSDALNEATDTAYDCHTSAGEALALASHDSNRGDAQS